MGCILSRVPYTSTVTAQIVNSNVAASLVGTGQGSLTIPADCARLGAAFRARLLGWYKSISSSPGTLTFLVKLGGVTVGTVAAFTLPNSAASWYLDLEATISIRAVGASGTVFAQGRLLQQSAAPATGTLLIRPIGPTTATTAIDWTTNSRILDVTGQFSVANAGNELNVSNVVVEALN